MKTGSDSKSYFEIIFTFVSSKSNVIIDNSS